MNKTPCNAEEYKKAIAEIVDNTDNADILKRIYNLTSYLYINNQDDRRNNI